VSDNSTQWAYINNSPVVLNCRSGGWTVIQSRGQFGNPPDFFYRPWSTYKNPFGTAGTLLNNNSIIIT